MADIVELRSSQDPQLATTLDLHLKQCREQQRTMGLKVIKEVSEVLASQGTPPSDYPPGSKRSSRRLKEATDGAASRGFLCDAGEIAIIVDDMDRNTITSILRDVLNDISQIPDLKAPMIDKPRLGLIGEWLVSRLRPRSFSLNNSRRPHGDAWKPHNTKAPAPLNRLKCFRISL